MGSNREHAFKKWNPVIHKCFECQPRGQKASAKRHTPLNKSSSISTKLISENKSKTGQIDGSICRRDFPSEIVRCTGSSLTIAARPYTVSVDTSTTSPNCNASVTRRKRASFTAKIFADTISLATYCVSVQSYGECPPETSTSSLFR
jgi:hypothetical protein